MSREVRKVPATWEHPKNETGELIPLYGGSYAQRVAEWDEHAVQWEKGFYRSFRNDRWGPKTLEMTYTYAKWDNPRPEPHDYMPDWPEAERTHYQMYETTTEGTPLSPVLESPEALAHWLADNNASAFGRLTATFEQWRAIIVRGGHTVSAIMVNGNLISGVEAESKH